MTSERDDRQKQIALRRRKRMKEAARREKQQKARRAFFLRLFGVILVLIFAGALIVWVNQHSVQPGAILQNGASGEQIEYAETTQPTEMLPYTTIHIAAAGDLNITDLIVENALTADGFDFTSAFLDVAPVLSAADYTVLNFEGTLAGEPYGTERGSAPQELAQHLKTIGVDAVQTANSASIRSGILGLQSTINQFYEAGILPVGTFADRETFRKTGGYSIVEVEGLRIALVGFTKGMDNLGLPEGSEDCVNLLYKDYTTDYKNIDEDGINKVLRRVAEEQPDLTIAMLHWGSENNEEVSDSQKRIRNLMLDGGVDVILGTHPHLVHTIEYDEEKGTLAAFSLGDFYGNADKAGTDYSLILDIEVTRDNLTGETKVTGYNYTPIFTLKPEQSVTGGQRVVRIYEAMSRYKENYLGKISDDTYSDMEYDLERLAERIHTELEE